MAKALQEQRSVSASASVSRPGFNTGREGSSVQPGRGMDMTDLTRLHGQHHRFCFSDDDILQHSRIPKSLREDQEEEGQDII